MSCAIPFEDHVILTGGSTLTSHEKVSKYSLTGWVEDLPSLITGRRKHGCSQYTDSSGRQVRDNAELSLLTTLRSTSLLEERTDEVRNTSALLRSSWQVPTPGPSSVLCPRSTGT